MTSSAWPLARRGRCGPCIALMTKKVEEGRRRCAYLCTGVQVRRPAAPSLSYLPLTVATSRIHHRDRQRGAALLPRQHQRYEQRRASAAER